jgi:transcriptional regulator with PAS, ATPase and Fis domain
MQAKLLRVLENRTVRRVGGTKSIDVDVRVIAATNRNLKEAIQQSDFREDLYYRLNVFPIHTPPLRERREDIPALVTFFLEIYSRKFSRSFSSIDPEALKVMMNYSWPGNIRELKNIIERICIMQSGPKLLSEYLPSEVTGNSRKSPELIDMSAVFESGLEEAVNRFEKELIASALSKCGKNVLQTAQLLKIPRGTLRYKMEKMGII